MELQGLHEALKVEIQCHQKLVAQMKQDPQKLAVRSCPVGTPNKPLSLIKPPNNNNNNSGSQSIAISVVPATKAPVSMVTAHVVNGQKAAAAAVASSDTSPLMQTSPVNLQTAGGRMAVSAGGAAALHRRAAELQNAQMLGTLTAVPIKVPQVSSLHRLAGQAPTVLPQVRPKTHIPDSLPHSPGQEQLSGGSLSLLQRGATTVISAKKSHNHHQGPALPTANSTFSPEHQPNALSNGLGDTLPPPIIHIPIAPPLAQIQTQIQIQTQKDAPVPPPPVAAIAPVGVGGVGVAYAIIAASPATGNGVSALGDVVKVQPLLFSADNKVIIIQPQVPSCSQGSPGPKAVSPAQEAAPPPPPPPAKKKDEDPEKIAFMVALGLVTTEHLEEIQTKRQERKRRSTANPAYSGLFEPERKRLASNYLNNPLFLGARDTEDLCWKEDLEHDDHCTICKEEGELQPCHNCTRAYHPNCLQPPLKTPPRGVWYCPKCQKKVLNKENMSWPQNFVQSYVTHKTVRQEEKRRLLRRNSELKKECTHLEEQDNRLNKSLTQCMDLRDHLLGQQRDTQVSLDRLKSLIRLVQQDQMIQVTMTATTTTTGASLLSLPWIKPAGAGSAVAPQTTTTAASSPPSAGPSALLHKTQSSNN